MKVCRHREILASELGLVVAAVTEYPNELYAYTRTKYSTPCGFEPPEPPPDAKDVDDIWKKN